MDGQIPDYQHRRRDGRVGLGRLARTDREARQKGAASGRRRLRHQHQDLARGNPARRRQLDPHQGEPDRDAHRDFRGDRAREALGLYRGDFAPVGGDRGHDYSRHRRRHERAANQDRVVVALGSGREIQSAAAYRGRSRRCCPLPGAGSLLSAEMKILAVTLAAFILLLQYPLWLGKGGWLRVWSLDQQVQEQKEANARLSRRNGALDAEVRDLKQGFEAIEERARYELGLIKQDEIFFQVVPPRPAP